MYESCFKCILKFYNTYIYLCYLFSEIKNIKTILKIFVLKDANKSYLANFTLIKLV